MDAVVNGVQEPESNEKILKPRTPKNVVSKDNEEGLVTNGMSHSQTLENNVANGHETELEIKNDLSKMNGDNNNIDTLQVNGESDSSKVNGVNSDNQSEHSEPEKKEETPRKTNKKIETPIKRELRRREGTPLSKESTPKVETPTKRKTRTTSTQKKEDISKHKAEQANNESVIILDESQVEDSSKNVKDALEASCSSPSIVCLDTPPVAEISPSVIKKDISSRKPINAFSSFPGKNVSIISVDSSSPTPNKRKAEDSFSGFEAPKRFAGETNSGSEKSPGWNFFYSMSPFSKKVKFSPRSSTPYPKKVEQYSMAVNYDEETKLGFEETTDVQPEVEAPHTTPEPKKWCTVM